MKANELFQAELLGLVRVAAVSPALRVADVAFNVAAICDGLREARTQGCALALFPELSLTGYTCGDLFRQSLLLEAALQGVLEVARCAASTEIVAVVGLPLEVDGRLFNCAALLADGEVKGVVPKTFLPNSGEFYEQRHFTPAAHACSRSVRIGKHDVPFGTDLLFVAQSEMQHCAIGIEICEDLWSVEPPSGRLARAGATILLNLSSSPAQLGKVAYRRELVRQQSARCLAAYVYAGSGPGESSSDLVFDGHALICENGRLLAESERFRFDTQVTVADVDVMRLSHERRNNTAFSDAGQVMELRRVLFQLPRTQLVGGLRGAPISRTPFVPEHRAERAANCREIFAIQQTGLARRLQHTGLQKVVIGVSGGLDSTLALLVAARAFDALQLPRAGIIAITMPGFGTTDRTHRNAHRLMRVLGVTARDIPIRDAVMQHFADIGHDPDQHDVTYENAQARERTQILMDVANQEGGLVVGTGDLSELALGWATFNGDHMSMYHVNAGVPKTLVRYLVEWCADEVFQGEAADVLRDILATPITPELLPLKDGALQQKTEEAIGPYVLHDFFLFHHVRYGSSPAKVFLLACYAFDGVYDAATVLRWLDVFYTRFFSQQFKRNAMPDGPKVGSVALSPRGDWRMPSDAHATLWRAQLAELAQRLDLNVTSQQA